jgi:hypothetical protein
LKISNSFRSSSRSALALRDCTKASGGKLALKKTGALLDFGAGLSASQVRTGLAPGDISLIPTRLGKK